MNNCESVSDKIDGQREERENAAISGNFEDVAGNESEGMNMSMQQHKFHFK